MSTATPRKTRTAAFCVALATLVIGAASLQAMVSALKATLKKIPIEAEYKLPSLPAEIPSWKQIGTDEQMTEEMVQELGTSNYLSRNYIEKHPPAGRDPRVLSLHVAYYTGMVDTVPHVPDRCLVGAGWSIASAAQILPLGIDQDAGQWALEKDVSTPEHKLFSARLGPDSKKPNTRVFLPRDADKLAIRVNSYTEPKASRKLFAGYFFIANGGHCADANDVRLLAFRLQDTYAYYLKVQISTASVVSEQEYVEACRSLLGELLPEIMLCAPDWVELQRSLSKSQPSAADHRKPNENSGAARPRP